MFDTVKLLKHTNNNVCVLCVAWTRRVNVVTPQLENLTIVRHFARFQVSAPALASLHFTGDCPWVFSTDDGFHSLKQVLFSFHSLGNPGHTEYANVIISMLQQFHSVKHLSLSTEIIQVNVSFHLTYF